jgi:UTP-glucose-1-phosphate uridylyltransferase
VGNQRWGGSTNQGMDELYRMEDNHANFVQNYYKHDNQYNKKLHKETLLLEKLALMKQQDPKKFKKLVQKLQSGEYGDSVNIADRFINYSQRSNSDLELTFRKERPAKESGL